MNISEPTDSDIASVISLYPNGSLADWSDRLGIHPAKLIQRLSNLPLKAALAENRAESLADAAILAESMAVRAVNTIAIIMDCPTSQDKDRIAAAKALVQVGIQLSEAVHNTPQIELLKHQLHEKGVDIKHARKYGRIRGNPRATPSISDSAAAPGTPPIPPEPDTSPIPAESVMDRVRDILRNAGRKGADNGK